MNPQSWDEEASILPLLLPKYLFNFLAILPLTFGVSSRGRTWTLNLGLMRQVFNNIASAQVFIDFFAIFPLHFWSLLWWVSNCQNSILGWWDECSTTMLLPNYLFNCDGGGTQTLNLGLMRQVLYLCTFAKVLIELFCITPPPPFLVPVVMVAGLKSSTLGGHGECSTTVIPLLFK